MEFIPEIEEVKRPYVTGIILPQISPKWYWGHTIASSLMTTFLWSWKAFQWKLSFIQKLYLFAGARQGSLVKRKKDADEWKGRWFILSHDYLSYYISYQVSAAQAVIINSVKVLLMTLFRVSTSNLYSITQTGPDSQSCYSSVPLECHPPSTRDGGEEQHNAHCFLRPQIQEDEEHLCLCWKWKGYRPSMAAR